MRRDEWFMGQPLREPFEERAFRLRVLNFAAGLSELLNGSCPGLYIFGKRTGGGSLLCCSPPASVSAT
jgi:hypothetical protein